MTSQSPREAESSLAEIAMRSSGRKSKSVDMWSTLNERQRAFMRIIYLTDQLQERNAKGLMRLEGRSIPTDRWRWIEYADTYAGHTRSKTRLKEAGLVDPGTGSTFEALRERGLILVKYDHAVLIRMTTKGRRVVRLVVQAEAEE